MRILLNQFSRFAAVGIAATLVHYLAIVALVDLLGWVGPTPATALGSVLGIATSYLGNAHFVFAVQDKRHTFYAPRFVVVYLAVLAIHTGMMHLFADVLGYSYSVGFVIATAFSAITTFVANRYLVFAAALGASSLDGIGRPAASPRDGRPMPSRLLVATGSARMPVLDVLLQRPRTTFAAFVLLHVLFWTLLPTLVNRNLPLDVIEHLAWGREWQWGYHKHPPLVAWLAELAGMLSGGADWGLYLLSQLCVATAFWSMWRLARDFVTPAEALLSVLLLEGVAYHNFTSAEFNVNVALLAFWALTILCFWRAVTTHSITAWMITGVVAACAVLSKYLAAFILLPLLLYLLFDREARQALRGPGPYLSVACLTVLIAPHLAWVWQHDFVTLGYGLNRAAMRESGGWSDHLLNPARFVLAQAAQLLLPALLLLSLGRPRWHGSGTPARRRYLHFVALAPVLLFVIISAVTGMRLRSMWGTPLIAIGGLYLLYFLRPLRASWRIPRFVAAWAVTALLFLAAYAGAALHGDGKRTQYPGAEIARQLEREWSTRFAKPLRYVIGDEWFAGNVGWYSAARPSVYLGADPLQAPWIDEAAVRRAGALVVWDTRRPTAIDLDALRARFGALQLQPPLASAWYTSKEGVGVSIGWALIPPAISATQAERGHSI